MFSQNLKNKQPFATKFFEKAITLNDSKLVHSYMFTGSNICEQYSLALELAKILNCQQGSTLHQSDCTCVNCSWINQNKHPAVTTISPVDFNFDAEGNKTSPSTVIKVEQARYLRNILAKSSNYYRVVIFTNATNESDMALNIRGQYDFAPPINDVEEQRDNWIPLPLNSKVFQRETANTLLKTIEEPNPNIMFCFLTRDKEDIIDTIVSRCQVIPVKPEFKYDDKLFLPDNFEQMFLPKNYNSALMLSESFIIYSKDNAVSISIMLDSVQIYLKNIIISNSNNERLTLQLTQFINNVELAKQRLTSYVSPQSVLDSLFLSLIN